MKRLLSVLMAVLFVGIMAGSAHALTFAWENDVNYAAGVILPDGSTSKLETVIEMKAPGADWLPVITATDGAATASYLFQTGYRSGDVLQFRAMAQIRNVVDEAGTVGLLKSPGYSNVVEYKIPYIPGPTPGDPQNLTISFEVAGQTYRIIVPPSAVN